MPQTQQETHPNQKLADQLYDDFRVGYAELWEDNGRDVEDMADAIFDRFLDVNEDNNAICEDGVQDLVYEHIYAGLT